MARPEFIADIELDGIEFATIEVDKITLDPALLKGYTAFLEAAVKGGASTDQSGYRGVRFTRFPNDSEQQTQLRSAQSRWDEGQKQYNILASIGECERSWDRDRAEEWAKEEAMPFPPVVEPISDFHAVINNIDAVTS